MEPFVVLDGITEVCVGQGGGLFDELERMTLGFRYGVRITVLRHVGNDLLTETVSDV